MTWVNRRAGYINFMLRRGKIMPGFCARLG